MRRPIGGILFAFVLAACGGNSGQQAAPNGPAPSGAATSPNQSHAGGSSSAATKPTSHPRSAPGGPSSPNASTGTAGGGGGGGGGTGGTGGGTKPKTNTSPAPQAIEPRDPGTYHYDTTGQTTYGQGFSQQLPSDTTLTAGPVNGVQQRSVRDLRDSQGNGSVTETWLEFRDDGVYLDRVRTSTRFGPVSDVRDLAPGKPALVAKKGAGAGAHTEFTMTGSNTKADVTIDVIREEKITIGGKAVDTFLVRTHTTFSGDLQGESTAETWFTPDHLLPVKEHVVTDAQTNAGSFHSEYRAQLKQLSPQ